MRRFMLCTIAVLVFSCSTSYADTYRLSWLGTYSYASQISLDGGLTWLGGGAYYAMGPYGMEVQDFDSSGTLATTSNQQLVCLAGQYELTSGTWELRSTSRLDPKALAVAYLMLTGSFSNVELAGMQFEVWQLMDAAHNYYSPDAGVMYYMASWSATDLTSIIPMAQASSFVYWPTIPPTHQPFLGVSEPPLQLLLGLGIFSIVALAMLVMK